MKFPSGVKMTSLMAIEVPCLFRWPQQTGDYLERSRLKPAPFRQVFRWKKSQDMFVDNSSPSVSNILWI